jgi:Haloacid dehalogenase-like hydrolase
VVVSNLILDFHLVLLGDGVGGGLGVFGLYMMPGLERLGLPAEQVLVVEDSPRGLQAALAAGIACIGIRELA